VQAKGTVITIAAVSQRKNFFAAIFTDKEAILILPTHFHSPRFLIRKSGGWVPFILHSGNDIYLNVSTGLNRALTDSPHTFYAAITSASCFITAYSICKSVPRPDLFCTGHCKAGLPTFQQ
jgi:hypothetical protein